MDASTPSTSLPVVKPAQQILQVRVLSPKKMIFLGQAESVTSTNTTGKFDILPQHANFITLIKNSPIVIINKQKQKVEFTFNLAIMYALNNNVTIYTEISTLKESNTTK
jgi:F0F1-type ATP synthase epsilon subunit